MRILFYLLPLIGLLAFACMEDRPPNPPVEVRFQLLNTSGEATTVFQEGEDIYFQLLIKNNSDENIGLFNFEPNDMKLFMVYQHDIDQEIGSPIKLIGQEIDILGYPIEGNASILFRVPWTGLKPSSLPEGWAVILNENNPLEAGAYFTAFDMNFIFAKFTVKEKFRIDFEVR